MTTLSNPRIAFVTASLDVWGAERSLLILHDGLKSQGVASHIIVDKSSPMLDQTIAGARTIKPHAFARKQPVGDRAVASTRIATAMNYARSTIKSGLALRSKLRSYDVVVIFSVWQSLEALIACIGRRQAVVLDLHETFSSQKSRHLLRLLCGCMDLVLTPSEHVRRTASTANAVVIYRPVETPLTRARNGSHEKCKHLADTITVGMFGQIAPHKRNIEVLESIVKLCEKNELNIQLLIVGGNPEPASRTSYEVMVRTLADMHSTVTVLDRVKDVWPLMQTCDIVVNMSEHEAFGRTVVEACYAGAIPVVADNGGPPEIVATLGVGVVCGIDDLEDGITAAMNQRAQLKKVMRERWTRDLDMLFGAESVSRKYLSSIREEVARRQYRRFWIWGRSR